MNAFYYSLEHSTPTPFSMLLEAVNYPFYTYAATCYFLNPNNELGSGRNTEGST